MGDPVTDPARTDSRLLRLADGDNVLIVRQPIPGGSEYMVDGVAATTPADLPIGFKVAGTDFQPDDVAIRLGMPIGRATAPIRRGELIHTHNLASLYMRTHGLGEA